MMGGPSLWATGEAGEQGGASWARAEGRPGRGSGAQGAAGERKAGCAGLDGGFVGTDPVDLEPGHEGGPGAGYLEQADADQHGAADPGHEPGVAAEERE